jgi:hypothetical protein
VLAARRAAWERNVSDSVMVQIALFNEIQKLASKYDTRSQALEKARAGLQRTEADLEALEAERADLAKEAGPTFRAPREMQRLKDLEDGKKQLIGFLKKQEEIERTENDPKKKEWRSKVEQARLLEQDAEIKKAIDIYKQVLDEGLDSPELRTHLADLEKMWKPADDAHDDARRFIYNVWPVLSTKQLKEKMDEATKAFAKCREVKDTVGPLRLFKATEAHAVRLKKELDALNPMINLDDEKPAQLIKEVSAGLVKLAEEIQLYLQKQQPPGS